MYIPIQPSQEDVERVKEMVKKEQGKDLSNQEAHEASYNFLNFFSMLLYLDNKQKPNKLKE